jgi:Uma2 family endonuclease
MTQVEQRRATFADLARFDGKAELIDGHVVELPMAGDLPGDVALAIAVALRAYARSVGRGKAHADGVDYSVDRLRSGRESFRPDASYYTQAPPKNRMSVVIGPPTLAVEVRSEGDYGPAAEDQMRAKRADYFEAGTLTVWDVDPVAETVVVYRRGEPGAPRTYRRGETAEAEPAAPGFTLPVDEVFKQ